MPYMCELTGYEPKRNITLWRAYIIFWFGAHWVLKIGLNHTIPVALPPRAERPQENPASAG